MSKIFSDILDLEVAALLRRGKIGVIKTDTLYGIVAAAENKRAVERVYKVRKRARDKPCIILIADSSYIYDAPAKNIQKKINTIWPDKTSIVLPAPSAPIYLTRKKQTLAYRVPASKALRTLLTITGPLIAPSANLAGEPPATSIHRAQYYFRDTIDFYVDEGKIKDSTPSKIIEFTKAGAIKKLR